MIIFLSVLTVLLATLSAFLFFKRPRGEDLQNQKDNYEKSISELQKKLGEFSNKNIALAGQYGEVINFNENLVAHVENLNAKINNLLEKQAAEIKAARLDANATQRAVVKGKIGEELVGLMKDFPYSIKDMRFFGSPVDYILFSGISDNNIQEIIFLECKSGNAVLTPRQKQIRDCIAAGKVKFEVFHIK